MKRNLFFYAMAFCLAVCNVACGSDDDNNGNNNNGNNGKVIPAPVNAANAVAYTIPPQQQPAIKKRFSIEETSNKPQNNAAKKENKPISLGGNKFKEMQAMLAQRGVGFGAPRPSAQMMGMPHGFGNMNINKNDNKSNPSVEEREDLDKKLDKIVVQKNKKKKKKPNLDLDS